MWTGTLRTRTSCQVRARPLRTPQAGVGLACCCGPSHPVRARLCFVCGLRPELRVLVSICVRTRTRRRKHAGARAHAHMHTRPHTRSSVECFPVVSPLVSKPQDRYTHHPHSADGKVQTQVTPGVLGQVRLRFPPPAPQHGPPPRSPGGPAQCPEEEEGPSAEAPGRRGAL